MKCVVNLKSINSFQLTEKAHGNSYGGLFAEISSLWGAEKLGFHLEILSPGKFSCPYHRHQKEEELFIALKGAAMVRQDQEVFEITEGDLVFFKTGTAHQFFNHTKVPFEYLALSNNALDDICEFPDSNKIWDRKAKSLTREGVGITDYWAGEENPVSNWPNNPIDR